MPLPAGILRESVTIQTPTETRNALGEIVQSWSTFTTRRASVIADSYSEQTRRGQIGGTTTFTVRMRYVPGLSGKMRVRWDSRDGRILYISGVVEKGFREEHELSCDEQNT
jgi:SPP1 family predicted phage head-tail adaptor